MLGKRDETREKRFAHVMARLAKGRLTRGGKLVRA
jgi:hypothetical protein